MKKHTPLLTLAVVALLGVVMLAVTAISNPASQLAAASGDPAGAGVTAPLDQPPADTDPPPAEPEPAAEPGVEPPVVDEKAYTGRSAGREVTVAVAVKAGRAVAYVCDGEQVEAWLEGTLEGDRLELEGADGVVLTAAIADKKVTGTVTVAGKQLDFEAKGVEAPAGLYEGRGNVDEVAVRIGWIVEPVEDGGTVTGVYKASDGTTGFAPGLDPSAPETSGPPGFTVTQLDGTSPVVGQ